MACPNDDTLLAMLERSIDPARFGELEIHIDSCEHCRKAVAVLALGSRSPSTPHTPFGDPASELTSGSTINDRYVVQSEIGRGGMGTVYVAHDKSLGRDVALKLHRAGSGSQVEGAGLAPAHGTDRLQREAFAMAKLAHPNVVNVFEVATVGDRMVVAMEYVRGTTLRGWLDARPRRWREIVAMLVEAGRGLAAAHAAGLVHRDFKPENVLVGEDGRPRVGDFGLARHDTRAHEGSAAELETMATALTVTNGLAGTPAYMAPEQFAGDPVDARCDQFAFCVVAWECLFGRRPFAGATLGALQLAIAEHQLDRPSSSDVPDRVRRTIVRGLSVEPGARFADMPALLVALQRAARPRTTRNAIATVISAIAVSGGAFATYHAVTERQHAAACDREHDDVRGLFGDPVRAAVRRDFVATGSAIAPSAYDHATSVLERYTIKLADEAGDVCRDDHDPERVAASRKACLLSHESELAGLVDAFVHADAELVQRAPDAAWAVFDPLPCVDTAALTATTLAPDQSAQLGKLKAVTRAGHFRESVAMAKPMLDDARAQKDKNFELAVLIALVDAQAEIDRKNVVATYHDALALAEALGRDLDAALAHDALATAAGLDQHDYALAHREIELARAKLTRIGGNAAAESHLFATEARIFFDENRQHDAETSMRHAIAGLEKVYGAGHPTVGSAYGTLAQILGAQGQFPASLEASTHALDVLSAAFGDHHPTVAGAQMTVAQGLLALGRIPEARDRLMRADAVFREIFGPDHRSRAAISANLGQLEQDQGHWDAALAAFRTSLRIIQRTEGPEAASVAGVEHDIANCLGALGRFDEALASATHAVSILEKLGADGDNRLGAALVVVAEVHLVQDHAALALPIAERALALASKRTADASAIDLADAQYLVARVLWALHRDLGRAGQLAEAASTTPDLGKRATIVDWLKTHGH